MTRFLRTDEVRILELIRRGQEEYDSERARTHYLLAFEQLDPHHIFRFCLIKTNPDIAEDVTQDALIAIYRSMPNFRGASKVSTWIYGICNNTVRKALRKRPPVDFSQAERPGREAQPDLIDELRRLCEEYGLNALKRKDRELFLQHFVLEIPLDDLVKANWWMSKKQLRERLYVTIPKKIRERLKNGH